MKKILLFLCAAFFLLSCDKMSDSAEFRRDSRGFYYKLISFDNTDFVYRPGYLAHLSVVFASQSDSVFWNSTEKIDDAFFIRIDSASRFNVLQACASAGCIGDSALLLTPKKQFFDQQFAGIIPGFATGDSVVRIYYKIKQVLAPSEFLEFSNIHEREEEEIRRFLSTNQTRKAEPDEFGIVWLQGQACSGGVPVGKPVTIQYRGSFLNGENLESIPQQMQFVYGTPDQVIPGINNVIGRLKVGENAKIILPSRLAFGEAGSSDGRVPPNTPLMYDISIIQ